MMQSHLCNIFKMKSELVIEKPFIVCDKLLPLVLSTAPWSSNYRDLETLQVRREGIVMSNASQAKSIHNVVINAIHHLYSFLMPAMRQSIIHHQECWKHRLHNKSFHIDFEDFIDSTFNISLNIQVLHVETILVEMTR